MSSLDTLLQSTRVWRAGEGRCGPQGVPTGFAQLDALLPGGWPRGALTELLSGHRGIGALGLLLPALRRLSTEGGWLAWVAPPHLPYAPALAAAGIELARVLVVEEPREHQGLWALEQTLRSGRCAAVLGWAGRLEPRALRRLQLAAATGGALGLLFRPRQHAGEASPAALRLALSPAPAGRLVVDVLKRRGGWPCGPVELRID